MEVSNAGPSKDSLPALFRVLQITFPSLVPVMPYLILHGFAIKPRHLTRGNHQFLQNLVRVITVRKQLRAEEARAMMSAQ